jgi:uncharacterized repeat protein (TIGR03803 family)
MFRIPARHSAARSLSLKFCLAFVLGASLLGIATHPAQAQEPKTASATIYNYANTANGNGYFYYGVLQAPDGNFYANGYQSTNILRVTPSGPNSGTISTLAGQLPSTCGVNVVGNLILASDGNLYGMTSGGGANSEGTFFQYVIATRTCTPIYAFTTSDGSGGSFRGWTYGADGYFYGLYGQGCANNYGCAFRISITGKLNILYNFGGGTDGGSPPAFMVEATDGNWYGTTNVGGSGANQGVFFKLTPGTTFPWVENALFNMSCTNGCYETGPMNEGTDGNLDGTFTSGNVEGDGNIFQFDFQGDYTDLVDFGSYPTSPYDPQSGVIIGGDGNMYGTTYGGAANNTGSVWTSTNAGTYTKLADFPANANSAIYTPQSPLLQASDGNFYGGSDAGGTKGYGGLFQVVVSPAVPAPVQVTLSSTTSSGSPITVSWKVLNATSPGYRACYLYEWDVTNKTYTQDGGVFTGKATGTQSGSMLSGSVSVTPTATGMYTYSVTCAGTETGISPTLNVTGISSFSTKTVFAASSNAIIYPGSDKFTATVTRVGDSGIPTGSVSVYCCGGDKLFTMNLNASGVASQTVSSSGEPLGNYVLYGVYNGDADDTKSTSNNVSVSLKDGTTTTLSVSPGTITEPADATITVTVAPTVGSVVPTGSVTIKADGQAVISNYGLSGGKATIKASTKGFPKGTYQVTATYNGSSTDATSTSTAQNVTLQ